MNSLSVSDLTVRYGDLTAVEAVSLAVEPGAVMGIVGESGSGKSTLARAIVGLAKCSGGNVEVGGIDVQHLSRKQRALTMRRVQMVFQDPKSALDPRFTVEQCISEAFLGGHSRKGSINRKERVRQLLEQVSLDPAVARSKPTLLSGGQRQRVAIARALGAEPEVLIADEVTASLDVSVQAVILNLLRNIQREAGLSMLFITHNLAVVRYMADEIAVMFQGRIIEAGPTDEVISNPQHPYTRALLEAVPRPGRRLSSSQENNDNVSAPDRSDTSGGCKYRAVCSIGPTVRPDREVCVTTDPIDVAAGKRNHAHCHFAEVALPRLGLASK
jgi:peptide/nickel transport system ATP-binding protein